jgi:hypothetical protein
MLNLTRVLRFIETRLGYKFIDLEVDTNEIIDNIVDESLRTFSKKFPLRVRHIIDTEKDRVEGYRNRYYIKTDYEILSVAQYYGNTNNSVNNDVVYMSGGYTNTTDYVNAQLLNDIASMVTNPTTVNYFDEDNSVEIYPGNLGSTKVMIDILCIHKDDFTTIPNNLEDEFKMLALYDTQIMLLPLRNRFSNLQTPFGSIELFIDQLQDAESKRDELLERWRNNYYKSPKRKKIFIR